MDHLKPLPDALLQELEKYCIPFREEFYECRIDNGERHDPIPDPLTRLTLNASHMVAGNNPCRQWRQVERFLQLMKNIREPSGRTLNEDLIGGLVRDPMVLRPRAMGKSLSTEALLKTIAATVAVPIPRPKEDLSFDLPESGVRVHLSPPSLGGWFDRLQSRSEDLRYRFYDFHPKEVYNRPDSPNTTDYPLPRGGKRIPRHGEKECRPSNKLLALIARSQ